MKTSSEILTVIKSILNTDWKRCEKKFVPSPQNIALTNEAGVLEGAVLYADMKGSSDLVHNYKDFFAAEMYKSFLTAVCEVIRNNSGEITSFDGDRVMAVFVGDCKCSNAAKTALQICAIVRKINELVAGQYSTTTYRIDYAVGVDVSDLFVVRTGVRGDNDLAWIGDAANVAAKLSEIRDPDSKSFISGRMFERINDDSKYSTATKEKCMWVLTQKELLGQKVYGSTWRWNF